MPGSWFGSDPDYPGFAGSQFRMLTQLSPGLDVQVVVFSPAALSLELLEH